MHYYKRYMGDYQADTGHLSLLEHGVYCMLLDHYYATSRPLTASRTGLMRLLRAIEPEEREAVDTVLEQFWHETDEGWVNERAQRDIEQWHVMRERNARIAAEREAARKAPEPKAAPTARPESSIPDCPYKDIIDLYHEMLPMLPIYVKRTVARDQRMKSRWREHPGLERFRNFFAIVQMSPFLLGKRTSNAGRVFHANLEWLMKPESFAKVLERRYTEDE